MLLYNTFGYDKVIAGDAGAFSPGSWGAIAEDDVLFLSSTDASTQPSSAEMLALLQVGNQLIISDTDENNIVVKRITHIDQIAQGVAYRLGVNTISAQGALSGDLVAINIKVVFGYVSLEDLTGVTGETYSATTTPSAVAIANMIIRAKRDIDARSIALGYSAPYDKNIAPISFDKASDLSISFIVAEIEKSHNTDKYIALKGAYRNDWKDLASGIDSFVDATKIGSEPGTESSAVSSGVTQTSPAYQYIT